MLSEDFEGVGPAVSSEFKSYNRLFITQPSDGFFLRDKFRIVDGWNSISLDTPRNYLVKGNCVPAEVGLPSPGG